MTDTPMQWKASIDTLITSLPGVATETYPEGEPFTTAMARGTMSVELFAPKNTDRQQPHAQDELYFVVAGTAMFDRDGETISAAAGDALFAPAGMPHRFEDMSDDFLTWVVFWGPEGGEMP